MKTFAEIEIGDVFEFEAHIGHDPYEKIGHHQARRVNSTRPEDVRNCGDDERVTVLYAMADRTARLRQVTDS